MTAKSTVAAAPPTPSSAAVGTEASGTTATTHAPATTRLPATTLATCRALEGLSAQLGAIGAEGCAVGDLDARLGLVLEALQAQVAGQKERARDALHAAEAALHGARQAAGASAVVSAVSSSVLMAIAPSGWHAIAAPSTARREPHDVWRQPERQREQLVSRGG